MRMNGPELICLTPTSLSLADWQTAINGLDLLVPLRLDESQPDRQRGLWHASIATERVIFSFRERDMEILAGELSGLSRYRHAFSTPNDGIFKECAAGTAAFCAYVNGTGGAFFDLRERAAYIEHGVKRLADEMIASTFSLDREYLARYPQPRPSGPVQIVVTVHNGP